MSGCEAQAVPGQGLTPAASLSGRSCLGLSGDHDRPHVRGELGSPGETTGFPSPTRQGGWSELAWRAGEGQTVPTACPHLPRWLAEPVHRWPQQQKRDRPSGDAAGAGEQQGLGGPRPPAHAVCTGHPSSALPVAGDWGCWCVRPPGAGSGTRAVGAAGENFRPHFSAEMLTGKKCRFCNFKTPDESSVISAPRKLNGRTRQTRPGPPGRPAPPASLSPRQWAGRHLPELWT